MGLRSIHCSLKQSDEVDMRMRHQSRVIVTECAGRGMLNPVIKKALFATRRWQKKETSKQSNSIITKSSVICYRGPAYTWKIIIAHVVGLWFEIHAHI